MQDDNKKEIRSAAIPKKSGRRKKARVYAAAMAAISKKTKNNLRFEIAEWIDIRI